MKASSRGDLFTQLTLEIFKVSGLLTNEGDKLTKAHGITSSRWKILGAISFSSTPLTVPQIGRAMGQSRQAVQRLADVMVKDGLLKLTTNPNHKRAKYLELTEKGKEVYEAMYEKQIPWAENCADCIEEQALADALSVVRAVTAKLESKDSSSP